MSTRRDGMPVQRNRHRHSASNNAERGPPTLPTAGIPTQGRSDAPTRRHGSTLNDPINPIDDIGTSNAHGSGDGNGNSSTPQNGSAAADDRFDGPVHRIRARRSQPHVHRMGSDSSSSGAAASSGRSLVRMCSSDEDTVENGTGRQIVHKDSAFNVRCSGSGVVKYREPVVLKAFEGEHISSECYLRGSDNWSDESVAVVGQPTKSAIFAFHHPNRLVASSQESRNSRSETSVTNPLLHLCGVKGVPANVAPPSPPPADRSSYTSAGSHETHCLYQQPLCIFVNVGKGKYLAMGNKGLEFKEPSALRKSKKKRSIQFYMRSAKNVGFQFPLDENKVSSKDPIILESVKFPGTFVASGKEKVLDREIEGEMCIKLGRTSKEQMALVFEPLLAPLNILVKLRLGSNTSYTSQTSTNTQPLESEGYDNSLGSLDNFSSASAVEDMAAVELIKRLPESLQKYVFTFRPGWIGICRLVSKSWRQFAEKHVDRISISNSYFGEVSWSRKKALKPTRGLVARCSNLRVLVLQGIDSLSEFVAEDLIVFKSLEVLSVGGCGRLGDGFAETIATSQPHLRTLNLAATQITDYGLERIAENCRDLELVNLYGCNGVSRAGIEILLSLPKLRRLNIRGIDVSKEDVDELRQMNDEQVLLYGPLQSAESIY